MVAHPGAAGGPGRVRPLNRPRPLRVETDEEGQPIAMWLSGRLCAVEAVLESWRIDDEWWRQRPVSRSYWRLLLSGGEDTVIYTDRMEGGWWQQRY